VTPRASLPTITVSSRSRASLAIARLSRSWKAGPLPRAPSAGRPSRVRRASDIPPQAVVFLWRPYMAFGNLTVLEGRRGQELDRCGARHRGLLRAGLPGRRSVYRTASPTRRGRRGDRAGTSTSGFGGSGAAEIAAGGLRLEPLPAPFLSGLLPPRCASLTPRRVPGGQDRRSRRPQRGQS